MRRLLISLICTATACATGVTTTDDGSSDAEAETAAPGAQPLVAPAFVGLYTSHATTHYNGDITALELQAPKPGVAMTPYVRERCYHTSCALPLPETDSWDSYTSSTGLTYLRFWSFTVSRDANNNLISTPAIADVYQVVTSSYGIKLRKSYSSRWMALYRTTPESRCNATDGTWANGDCACPLNTPGQPIQQVFVPGAGGCIDNPGASETNCDDSDGLWADDDGTLIGSYCLCGLGRYDDATGTCAAI
jgi:hypothetical protein